MEVAYKTRDQPRITILSLKSNILRPVYFFFYSSIVEYNVLLLLLLSRFSRVRLCATPETVANEALPSLGFSRQECWSGLPFPSPVHESEK